MSFNYFRRHPKEYLRTHGTSIGGLNQAVTAAMNTPGGTGPLTHGHSELWDTIPLNYLTMIQMIAHNAHHEGLPGSGVIRRLRGTFKNNNFVCIANPGGDNGFRYLPYRADHCTYMKMDGPATFFVTGPLQGCTLAAARHPVTNVVWCFHANANALGGGPLGAATKVNMIVHTAGGVGIPAANLEWCVYDPVPDNTHYNGLGFVWGRIRRNNDWKFYVHWIPGGGGSNNSKWGTV